MRGAAGAGRMIIRYLYSQVRALLGRRARPRPPAGRTRGFIVCMCVIYVLPSMIFLAMRQGGCPWGGPVVPTHPCEPLFGITPRGCGMKKGPLSGARVSLDHGWYPVFGVAWRLVGLFGEFPVFDHPFEYHPDLVG